MRKSFEQLFASLPAPEPHPGFFEAIIQRIAAEQRLSVVKRRFVFFSVIFLGSIVALIPVFRMVWTGLTESGFIDFFSLLFSDIGAVVASWQSFVSALLETLPVMSIALFLAIIFTFLESLRFLTRDIKIVFKPLNTYAYGSH